MTELLSWCGLVAILWAVFCYDRHTRFPGTTALLPCVGTALVIWTNSAALTSVGKLLALRPIVFIGLISYSLYLWHWPVLVFFKYWAIDPVSQGQRLLLLLLSFVLAVLSWKFVETPFRQRRVLKTRSQVFSFACGATAILLISGVVVFRLRGMPSRIPDSALRYSNGEADQGDFTRELGLKDVVAGDLPELGAGNKRLPIGLLVWGDSHAMAVMPVLNSLCTEHAVRGVAVARSATAPLVGYENNLSSLQEQSLAFSDAVVEFIRKQRVGNVLLVAHWGGYGSNGSPARLHRALVETLSRLKGTGTKVWIVREVPRQPWDVPRVTGTVAWHGGDPERLGLPLADHLKEVCRQHPIFEGLEARFPNVQILDPTGLLVGEGSFCRVAAGGKALYWDNHHLSVAGAMLLRSLFEPIFRGVSQENAFHH